MRRSIDAPATSLRPFSLDWRKRRPLPLSLESSPPLQASASKETNVKMAANHAGGAE
jgi:hypothetical protein